MMLVSKYELKIIKYLGLVAALTRVGILDTQTAQTGGE